MKKIMLSLAAVLTFGIASAQVNPDQPQQTQPDPNNAVAPDTKNKADQDVDVPIDPKTIEEPKHSVINDGDKRKDQLTTKEHVKSTPNPALVKKDVDKPRRKTKSSRSKN